MVPRWASSYPFGPARQNSMRAPEMIEQSIPERRMPLSVNPFPTRDRRGAFGLYEKSAGPFPVVTGHRGAFDGGAAPLAEPIGTPRLAASRAPLANHRPKRG